VAVERHGGHVEVGGDPAHRGGGQPLGVGDRGGGADDLVPEGVGVSPAALPYHRSRAAGAACAPVRDDRADPGHGVDESLLPERGQGLAGGGHRHPPLADELPGGGQPVTRRKVAGGDPGA
jgi:hypothetical protein